MELWTGGQEAQEPESREVGALVLPKAAGGW